MSVRMTVQGDSLSNSVPQISCRRSRHGEIEAPTPPTPSRDVLPPTQRLQISLSKVLPSHPRKSPSIFRSQRRIWPSKTSRAPSSPIRRALPCPSLSSPAATIGQLASIFCTVLISDVPRSRRPKSPTAFSSRRAVLAVIRRGGPAIDTLACTRRRVQYSGREAIPNLAQLSLSPRAACSPAASQWPRINDLPAPLLVFPVPGHAKHARET